MNEPYINSNGDLIIPNGAEPKYQWWNETNPDRMSLEEILDFVGATEEHRRRYLKTKEVEDKPEEVAPQPKKKGRSA